jgi:hypothetical protein
MQSDPIDAICKIYDFYRSVIADIFFGNGISEFFDEFSKTSNNTISSYHKIFCWNRSELSIIFLKDSWEILVLRKVLPSECFDEMLDSMISWPKPGRSHIKISFFICSIFCEHPSSTSRSGFEYVKIVKIFVEEKSGTIESTDTRSDNEYVGGMESHRKNFSFKKFQLQVEYLFHVSK